MYDDVPCFFLPLACLVECKGSLKVVQLELVFASFADICRGCHACGMRAKQRRNRYSDGSKEKEESQTGFTCGNSELTLGFHIHSPC